jgi:hypothetical protein
MAIACATAFYYGNRHSEEFRLEFPRFEPWLWNLYLTCAVAGLAGILGLWWCRRWGFWTLLVAGVLASAIGLYAMHFTLIGAAVALALVATWIGVQPDWRLFR